MNRGAADTLLFGEALACEDAQRCAFIEQPLDPALVDAACARAELYLSAIAVIEDSRNEEEEGPQGLALRRIEAKLDLMLTLLSGLSRTARADPLRTLHWSALGARMPTESPLAEGSSGLFQTQAAPWMPEPLQLPATVIACQPQGDGVLHLWLQFGPLTEGTSSALERHLFRQHRRAIAERRRQT